MFESNRKGHYDLFRKSAVGVGAEELLYADNLDKTPTSWSADGKFLLYAAGGPKAAEVWALPLTPAPPGGALKLFPVPQTAYFVVEAQFSPDGRWIAYTSSESQSQEVYLTPFSSATTGPGGKLQVSAAGGFRPRWRQDGKEIFYVAPDRRLMAAEIVARGGTLEVGQVRSLFGATDTTGTSWYDVSADGQRFLFLTLPEQNSGEPLTLIQNWVAGLKK